MIFPDHFLFPGKYAKYARELTTIQGVTEGIPVFTATYETLLYSAAVGICQNVISPEKEKTDETDSAKSLKVLASQLSGYNVNETFKFLYFIAMLQYKGDQEEPLSNEERIRRACVPINVTDDTKEDRELTRKCEKIFERYVYAGLEKIHEHFSPEIEDAKKHKAVEQDALYKRELNFLRSYMQLSNEKKAEIFRSA